MIVSSISWNSTNEIAKPMNHQIGVLRFRTIELILSVTEANVSPGPTTGCVVWIGPSVYGSSAICQMSVLSSTFRLLISMRTS